MNTSKLRIAPSLIGLVELFLPQGEAIVVLFLRDFVRRQLGRQILLVFPECLAHFPRRLVR